MNTCIKCGYQWNGLVENPKQCPRCKRYDWKEETGKTINGFPLLNIEKEVKGGKE